MRRARLEWQVAELVDDQQLGFAEMNEPVLEFAFALRLGELGNQDRRRHKQDRIAGEDRPATNRDRKVRLADAGRAAAGRRTVRRGPAASAWGQG